MLVGAAASLRTAGTTRAPVRGGVVLDVAGRRVELTEVEAARLRDAAAGQAGRSSVARDLSLLLHRGLGTGQVLALRRTEAHELARLAASLGLPDISRRAGGEAS
jgi:hypothetical protein